MFDLTISIVVYKNNREDLRAAVDSALASSLNLRLYIVDNSPTNELQNICNDPRSEYIFNNANLGFGKAHNLIMKKAVTDSRYHLVLNPDIYFGSGVLEKLFEFMEEHPDVGHIMPKVLYPDGRTQHLCKLLPTPLDLIMRRFLVWFPGNAARDRRYELIDTGYDKIMNIPFLSGCFMFLRSSALKKVGFFEERIFMYVEDTDLSRRIHEHYRNLFYPAVQIHHHYHKGSYKSLKLMYHNIHGAVVYFSKWGWFVDKRRREINKTVLAAYVRQTRASDS